MRNLIFILCFVPTCVLGQMVSDWMPLPTPDTVQARVVTNDARITKREPKPQTLEVIESYLHSNYTFLKIYKPQVKPALEFEVYDMPKPAKTKKVGPMIFKDNATTNIKYIDQTHGLFNDRQATLTHDQDGLVYINSSSGFTIYNGDYAWYYHDTEYFAFTGTSHTFCDSKGRVWISSPNGPNQLCYIKDDKVYIPNNNFNGIVENMNEGPNGDVWVSVVGDGAYQIKDDGLIHYFDGLPSERIWDMHEEESGRIWIAQEFDDLLFLQNDSLFSIKDLVIQSFAMFDGALWLGTKKKGLYKWQSDSLFKIESKLDESTASVRSLVVNDKGLWGTQGRRVFLIKADKSLTLFTTSDGISHLSVYNLHLDAWNNVWIGTVFRGISKIGEISFYIDEIRQNHWYEEKVIDGKTQKWQGGVGLIEETETELIHYGFSDTSQPKLTVWDGIIADTCIWIGTKLYAVTRYQDGKFTSYHFGDVFTDGGNSSYTIVSDKADNLWGTLGTGELVRLSGDTYLDYSKSPVFEGIWFYLAHKMNSGKVMLVPTIREVVLIDGDRFRFIGKGFIDEIGRIFYVEEVAEDEYIVFAQNQTIHIKPDGTEIQIQHPFLKGNFFWDVQLVEEGKYLVSTNDGMLILQLKDDGYEIKTYGTGYGPSIYDTRRISTMGTKFNIHPRGLVYDPNMENNTEVAPKLSLRHYSIDTNTYYNAWSSERLEQESAISFLFNNICWGSESQLKFRLIKNGKEQSWQENGSNTITFAGLAHGNYALEAYSHNDKLNSDVLRYEFAIKPYWYQTIWANIAAVAFLILIFIAYIIYRARKAKKVEAKLQRLVDEKTMELQEEKDEVISQLSQKELLLKEVTHRVKNNMQMVSSILELQSFRAKDDLSKQALDEGISRINSLAMAHQNLYQNEDFTNINLKEYLGLILRYLIDDDKYIIEFQVPENYLIDIEKAQALGFILNELLTNSIKYAWADETAEKNIKFKIETVNDKTVATYHDNGIGFKDGYSFENDRSLGNVLITSFVQRQLEGELEMTNDGGAKTTITFNKDVGR